MFEGEKLRISRILSGLENFTLEHFGPSKTPLKTYFQWFKLTAPLVIDILITHYL